jgi:putative membrane protein
VLVDIAWIAAGLLVPFTAWLAVDAYRALGHAVHGRHIVTRYGTFSRKTIALERDGIIGWKIVRSPMQRWAGLSTVIATTAAGKEGAYPIRDVTLSDGVAFAEDSVPGLISPFVRRH